MIKKCILFLSMLSLCFSNNASEQKTTPLLSFKKEVAKLVILEDKARIEEHIACGFDINSPISSDGAVFLHVVCVHPTDKQDLVRFLISKGANINVRAGQILMGPLHVACAQGNSEVVNELIMAGAIINSRNDKGETPLYTACEAGQTIIVSRLLQEPSIQLELVNTDFDATALHMACLKGHILIVNKLIYKGASINAQNKDGATPLFLACQEGYSQVVNTLLDHGAHIDTSAFDGATPFHVAVTRGHIAIMRILQRRGAQIHLAKTSSVTPLYSACQNGKIATVEFLLTHNADIRTKHRVTGFTVLHLACVLDRMPIVKLFLNNKQRSEFLINDPAIMDVSQLRSDGKLNDVSFEPEGIRINPHTHTGHTPLHLACWWGNNELVKLLLDAGADIHLKTTGGATALDFAQEKNHEEIVALLKQSRCGECHSPAKFLKCAGCKRVFYCNEVCQKKHWKIHKQACKKCSQQNILNV